MSETRRGVLPAYDIVSILLHRDILLPLVLAYVCTKARGGVHVITSVGTR